MIELLAKISPRLRAILELPGEVREAFAAVLVVLAKYTSDPDVQAALNEIRDVQIEIAKIIGSK